MCTPRRMVRSCPKLISARSKAARRSGRIIIPAFARSTSTCARRRNCVRFRCSASLRAALGKLGVEYEIEMYASKMGYEAKGAESVIKVLEESYQSLFGKKTPAPTGVHASIWTDTNIYNEMGIPACKFGLGGGTMEVSLRANRDRGYLSSGASLCLPPRWKFATGTSREISSGSKGLLGRSGSQNQQRLRIRFERRRNFHESLAAPKSSRECFAVCRSRSQR